MFQGNIRNHTIYLHCTTVSLEFKTTTKNLRLIKFGLIHKYATNVLGEMNNRIITNLSVINNVSVKCLLLYLRPTICWDHVYFQIAYYWLIIPNLVTPKKTKFGITGEIFLFIPKGAHVNPITPNTRKAEMYNFRCYEIRCKNILFEFFGPKSFGAVRFSLEEIS